MLWSENLTGQFEQDAHIHCYFWEQSHKMSRGYVLASCDIWNQRYLPITCAIKRLEDVKQALSANSCTSMSDLRGGIFLCMARV